MEIWKDIVEYEGIYQVSNLGRVKSIHNTYTHNQNGMRIPSTVGCGYLAVALYKNSKGKNHKIHRLLAQYFIPNPHNYKCVNHIDGNKLNNSLDNLEWCTSAHNNKHAWDIGLKRVVHLRDKHANVQFTDNEVRELRKITRSGLYSCASIARAYKVSNDCIYNIKNGRTYRYVT